MAGYRSDMPERKEIIEVAGRAVPVSNPGKIYFPRTGHTKLDLVRYYLSVADGALRGVAGRPMVLKRFVNGAEGEAFFQKRAPSSRPDWIETVELSFPSGRTAEEVLAREIERRAPQDATSRWWKEERHGVFVDYNQNAKDRTVASAYSVRPTPDARVSMPLAWDEVPECRLEDFTIDTVPGRYARLGDVGEGIDSAAGSLQPLLELAARDAAARLADAPWPPHFDRRGGGRPRATPPRGRGRAAPAAVPPPPAPGRSSGPAGRRRPSMPLIEVARAATKDEAMQGLDRWKQRHPRAWSRLEPPDVLVHAMPAPPSTWTHIPLHLRTPPPPARPPQEALEVDYDPWAAGR